MTNSEYTPSTLRARSEQVESGLVAFCVNGWSDHFTVSQSNRVKNPSWFPMTNKYDSAGVLDLLDNDKGLEALGAWLLVTQLASTMPQKGVFVTDSGKPMSLKRIGQRLRIDSSVMTTAAELLLSVGWLGVTENIVIEQAKSENAPSTLRARSEQSHSEVRDRREEKRREEKNTMAKSADLSLALDDDGFEEWYNAYPNKKKKPDAHRAWKRLTKAERQKALEILPTFKGYKEQTKEAMPYPASFLNGRRWDDDLTVPTVNGHTTKSIPGVQYAPAGKLQ